MDLPNRFWAYLQPRADLSREEAAAHLTGIHQWMALKGHLRNEATTFYGTEFALGQFDLGKAAALSLVYNLIILIVCWIFYTVMTNAGADRPAKESVV